MTLYDRWGMPVSKEDKRLDERGLLIPPEHILLLREIVKMLKKVEEANEFKPVFLGFTGGVREGESMKDFCERINKEEKQ